MSEKKPVKHDVMYTENTYVYCEGNGPALGHPRVFLDLSKEGKIKCPYCSRAFVLKKIDYRDTNW